jgi:hypothetical protein
VKIQCAWCSQIIGVKGNDVEQVTEVTHSICGTCREKVLQEELFGPLGLHKRSKPVDTSSSLARPEFISEDTG